MGRETELAIVFADVVGSTRLYETLGDQRARDTVALCIDIMRIATEQHRGTVIKTMGDEVMATFEAADDALNASSQMQKAIGAHPQLQLDDGHVAIRIGCHYGAVVVENRDVFGSAVATANRMTSQAKAGQIMTTAAMVDLLGHEWRSSVRQIDVAKLKGRTDEVVLFEVLWQSEDVTSMVPAIALGVGDRMRPRRLRLRLQGQEVVVDGNRQFVTVGRAEDNDLVVKGNLISRLHARIEVGKQRFMLVDQSTNGSFVVQDGGEEQFVRRDSVALGAEGLIGLGKSPERDSSQTLRFVCED
jgi:adenylate cyclase